MTTSPTNAAGDLVTVPRSVLQPFSDLAGVLFARNFNADDQVVAIWDGGKSLMLPAGDFFALRHALASPQHPVEVMGLLTRSAAWRLAAEISEAYENNGTQAEATDMILAALAAPRKGAAGIVEHWLQRAAKLVWEQAKNGATAEQLAEAVGGLACEADNALAASPAHATGAAMRERLRGMLAMAIASEDSFNRLSPAGYRLIQAAEGFFASNREDRDDLQVCWDALQAETKRADAAEARLVALASPQHPAGVKEALEAAALWHDAQDKAISKQPNANVGHNGWMRNEHQEQASLLRAALSSPAQEVAAAPVRTDADGGRLPAEFEAFVTSYLVEHDAAQARHILPEDQADERIDSARDIVKELGKLLAALKSEGETGPAVAVKPLEWSPWATDGSTEIAATDLAHYVVWESGGRGYLSTAPGTPGQAQDGDLAAAKAAAQADFDKRIRAALTVSPSPFERDPDSDDWRTLASGDTDLDRLIKLCGILDAADHRPPFKSRTRAALREMAAHLKRLQDLSSSSERDTLTRRLDQHSTALINTSDALSSAYALIDRIDDQLNEFGEAALPIVGETIGQWRHARERAAASPSERGQHQGETLTLAQALAVIRFMCAEPTGPAEGLMSEPEDWEARDEWQRQAPPFYEAVIGAALSTPEAVPVADKREGDKPEAVFWVDTSSPLNIAHELEQDGRICIWEHPEWIGQPRSGVVRVEVYTSSRDEALASLTTEPRS